MARQRQVNATHLKQIKYWLRWTRRIGNRAQLAHRLGISEVTLSRYIRAINFGVEHEPFNASGYVLNKRRTGYVGAKPRRSYTKSTKLLLGEGVPSNSTKYME